MNNTDHVRFAIGTVPEKQLDLLHMSSLRILEQVGVNIHDAGIRDMLKNAGAKIHDDLRVSIPAKLVENALKTAPSRIDIYDRNGEAAMILEGTRSYYGTGSDLKYTIDSATQQRRLSTLKDVELSARICEQLANIDFVMSYALPDDVQDFRAEIEQMRVLLAASSKPLVMTVFSEKEAFRAMHQLAVDSCGGDSNFRDQPNYLMYGQFVSPLQHDADALDRLLFCADNAIPLIYVPTIIVGSSGPVTLAGSLALANAECLAGLVMHQHKSAGAPFVYGGCVSPLDMKTTVFVYDSPEWRMADIVMSQLSQRYDLPVFGTAGASDGKTIDAQAGAEWSYSLLVNALAGTNLIHDVGYMESGLTGSLEALVIVDEIIGMVKRVVSGFEITEETLALDLIKNVGPAGHCLAEEHTLAHFREMWYPSAFERDRFENWQASGGTDVLQRARQRVAELLQ